MAIAQDCLCLIVLGFAFGMCMAIATALPPFYLLAAICLMLVVAVGRKVVDAL